MTTLLAFDSSGNHLVVGLKAHNKVYSFNQPAPQQHAQLILPTIQAILQQAQVTLGGCDAIAVGCGPGSFMGVRIAVATAQGLGYGCEKPVIVLSSLQIVAQSIYRRTQQKKIVVSCDARKNEFYWGIFTLQEGIMVTAEEKLSARDLIVAADDVPIYQDEKMDVAALLELAEYYFARGQFQNALAVAPIYLRNDVTG